ncbi:MAG: methionyl-tRNA formyltransferase [bacterium]
MEKNSKLNFVFWGTPDVASETLEILKKNGYVPSLIVTAPDRPQGRKMLITPPPVKVWAIENNIPYLQPENLKGGIDIVFRNIGRRDGAEHSKSSAEDFCGEQNIPDLFLVVAYGKIMPEELLNLPKLGSLNIHYSLLPKYRGASPVESAILAGDTETGISIQKMIYKMDAGPMVAQEKVVILPDEKASELRTKLIKIGGELLVKTLPDFINNKITLTPQEETNATHCKKIKKEDGLIDLNDDPIKNYNKFRAYATWPRTFFFRDGKRIIITNAKLENGTFKILKIIPEGGKEVLHRN